MNKKLNLALFISGGGTTAGAIVKATKNGILKLNPCLVVASKKGIRGIDRLLSLGINPEDMVVIESGKFKGAQLADRILYHCRRKKVDFIGQYGWLPLTPAALIRVYKNRIINQHPGPLDPGYEDFGGKGMYGRRVHAAVLYFRKVTGHDSWTEATAHFVTNEFDKGEVIGREKIPVYPSDSVEELQTRVLLVEHRVQIKTLQDLVRGRLRRKVRRKRLIGHKELTILKTAKFNASIYYPGG